MHSRLAAKATTFFTVISLARSQASSRGLASAPTSRRPADPEIHSEDPVIREELVHPVNSDKIDDPRQRGEDGRRHSRGTEPLAPPKPPYAASPKLASTGMNRSLDPKTQQKRIVNTEAICVGVDGTPLTNYKGEDGRGREENEEDYKAYYSHRKASPLSEIAVADTRKPITRATDGTYGGYEGDRLVIGWLPEQLETVDDAMRRAVEIWKQSAMTGDPDSPQSRVLRALRGES